jgi:hypothetical protein
LGIPILFVSIALWERNGGDHRHRQFRFRESVLGAGAAAQLLNQSNLPFFGRLLPISVILFFFLFFFFSFFFFFLSVSGTHAFCASSAPTTDAF